SVKASGGSSSV
nr:ApcE=core-membrane linker phycobiliprotein [Calothrix sp., PCC 7601, phycobilisomes, Peptide Partial, 11 aa] [Calothrix]